MGAPGSFFRVAGLVSAPCGRPAPPPLDGKAPLEPLARWVLGVRVVQATGGGGVDRADVVPCAQMGCAEGVERPGHGVGDVNEVVTA